MIIVVHGLPATGKTFFSEQLSREIDAIHISTDMIRDQLGMKGQYDMDSKTRVYDELMNQVKEKAKENKEVIADGTFHLRNRRDRIKKLAEETGSMILFIEMKAMEDVIAKRLREKREFSEADLEAYKKIKDVYEENLGEKLVLWSDRNNAEQMIEKAKEFIYG